MSRKQELERELYRLECGGYPGSESPEFKRACERMRTIEEELKTLEAADEIINTKTIIKKSTKEKSWTRQEYETAYRGFRRLAPEIVTYRIWGIANEIVNAADYSYQARDYIVHGWSNERRKLRFHQMVWRILSREEQIN